MGEPVSSGGLLDPAPRVGIVVLNYRRADCTLRCLESLRRISYANAETVVVDNASGDGSAERIRRDHPWVTVLESPSNLGYAGGNAIGYAYFRSRDCDYLWILNNDTEVDPGALGAMVQELRRDPSLGAVGSILTDRATGEVLAVGGGRINFFLGRSAHVTDLSDRRGVDYLTGASLLVPMGVFERHGFIDDAYFLYYEDADFCYRLRKAGLGLGTARQAVVFHDESSSVGRQSLALLYYANRSFVRFMTRHSPIVPVSIAVGAGARLALRLLSFRAREAAVLLRALRDGWRERHTKSTAVENL